MTWTNAPDEWVKWRDGIAGLRGPVSELRDMCVSAEALGKKTVGVDPQWLAATLAGFGATLKGVGDYLGTQDGQRQFGRQIREAAAFFTSAAEVAPHVNAIDLGRLRTMCEVVLFVADELLNLTRPERGTRKEETHA